MHSVMSSSWFSNSSLVSSEPWFLSWKHLVWMEVLSNGSQTSNKLETYDHQGLFVHWLLILFLFVPCTFENIQPFKFLTICLLQVLQTSTSCSSFHLATLSEMFAFQNLLEIFFQQQLFRHLSFPLMLCLVTRTFL